MSTSSSFEFLLDALADRIADRLVARLGRSSSRAVYSTSKRGPHAPGKSRAWLLRNIKAMPGAHRVGRDWIISADDFEHWAIAQDAARANAQIGSASADEIARRSLEAHRERKRVRGRASASSAEVDALAAKYLEAAGFRPTANRK